MTNGKRNKMHSQQFYIQTDPNERFFFPSGQIIGSISGHGTDWCFSFILFMKKSQTSSASEQQILHLMTSQGKSNPEIKMTNNTIIVLFSDISQEISHPKIIPERNPTNITICRIHSTTQQKDQAFLTIEDETVESDVTSIKGLGSNVKIFASDPWKRSLTESFVKDLYYQEKGKKS